MTKLTLEQIQEAVRILDEAHVPQEDRQFWCPFCKDWHSENTPPPPDCQLVKELLNE